MQVNGCFNLLPDQRVAQNAIAAFRRTAVIVKLRDIGLGQGAVVDADVV